MGSNLQKIGLSIVIVGTLAYLGYFIYQRGGMDGLKSLRIIDLQRR